MRRGADGQSGSWCQSKADMPWGEAEPFPGLGESFPPPAQPSSRRRLSFAVTNSPRSSRMPGGRPAP
ncbi:hypothetical protein HMPREF9946_00799 [Acetobacteraceae bacterium AT-5844]|nr:hypothetical protein HMPREF9946_00799 [Acetobacteraceae bacterium AT-5844]